MNDNLLQLLLLCRAAGMEPSISDSYRTILGEEWIAGVDLDFWTVQKDLGFDRDQYSRDYKTIHGAFARILEIENG